MSISIFEYSFVSDYRHFFWERDKKTLGDADAKNAIFYVPPNLIREKISTKIIFVVGPKLPYCIRELRKWISRKLYEVASM